MSDRQNSVMAVEHTGPVRVETVIEYDDGFPRQKGKEIPQIIQNRRVVMNSVEVKEPQAV